MSDQFTTPPRVRRLNAIRDGMNRVRRNILPLLDAAENDDMRSRQGNIHIDDLSGPMQKMMITAATASQSS